MSRIEQIRWDVTDGDPVTSTVTTKDAAYLLAEYDLAEARSKHWYGEHEAMSDLAIENANKVRSLEDELDKARKILRQVADTEPRVYDGGGPEVCLYCRAPEQTDGSYIHNIECTWVAAAVEAAK